MEGQGTVPVRILALMFRVREVEFQELTPPHGATAFQEVLRVMALKGRKACHLRKPARRPSAQQHMENEEVSREVLHTGLEGRKQAMAVP